MKTALEQFIINKQTVLKIFLNDLDIESINIAVESFRSNIEEIICKTKLVDNISDADIIIQIKKFDYDEQYKYTISKNKIIIEGNDDLGVIFGIYSFLENEFNIPPFYLMEDYKLIKRDNIELNAKTVSEYPQSRFRGWFINDEDLIGSFKSIHNRVIPDYPFYHDVINPKMMEIICETILRYRMNLIIPSTLINIMSPYERELVEICSRRGLYISQHHIESLGVSKYGFKDFAQKNNLNDDFSYIDNQMAMEKCYEAYAKEWSKFPRVVWQVGLRGAGDRPFWNNETNLSTEKMRGEIISSVIKKQIGFIKKYSKGELYATSTLWMEGANLLAKGMLDIPKEVIVVFADVGMSQLFGEDFFEVKRDSTLKYGIYYHAAYCHTGPHLAEGLYPEKLEYCYRLARDKNSLYFSIINACNVKELTFSLYLNSKYVWNSSEEIKNLYNKYVSFLTNVNEGKELLIDAIKSYYRSLKDIGDSYYKDFCDKYNFSYHKYENLPFPIVSANDGLFKAFIYNFYFEDREKIRIPIIKNICKEGHNEMAIVIKKFEEAAKYINDGYLDGFNSHWYYQANYMFHLLKSCECFYDACEEGSKHNYETSKKLYEESSNELAKILDDRKKLIKGSFENWYDNDHKIDIPFLVKRIMEDYDRVLEINNIAK